MNKAADNHATGILMFAFSLLSLGIITNLGEITNPNSQYAPYDNILLLSNKEGLQLAAVGDTNETPAPGHIAPMHTPFFFMPVPVNDASVELLKTVPGIGPRTAARIVDLRTKSGKVSSIDQLLSVSGIGPGKLKRMKPHLSVQ